LDESGLAGNRENMASSVFDETAAGFAQSADRQTDRGRYFRGDLFVAAARSFVAQKGRILDYGCGPGRISALLAREGFRVLGLDPSPAMIEQAKQQRLDGLEIEFQQCPRLPVSPQGAVYDAIVCSSVLEYVTEPEEFLRWFESVLRPSGVLIVSFANNRSLWRHWSRWRYSHVYQAAQLHTWSRRRFSRLLSRAGFAPGPAVDYFDSPLDGTWFSGWSLAGTLGFLVARKSNPLPEIPAVP
jgi:2-polyprenyl-3-methyl-5-hydroxy-6-metoxy-1,4-benzoquinol methylase